MAKDHTVAPMPRQVFQGKEHLLLEIEVSLVDRVPVRQQGSPEAWREVRAQYIAVLKQGRESEGRKTEDEQDQIT